MNRSEFLELARRNFGTYSKRCDTVTIQGDDNHYQVLSHVSERGGRHIVGIVLGTKVCRLPDGPDSYSVRSDGSRLSGRQIKVGKTIYKKNTQEKYVIVFVDSNGWPYVMRIVEVSVDQCDLISFTS